MGNERLRVAISLAPLPTLMFGRQTPTNKRAAIRPAQKYPGRGLKGLMAGMRQDR